ncbi:hypothetical protein AB4114_11005 [Paenibacillus sp. 2RAB27]|uniref:structural cement protein Gp24 n=1 Tax=Paenibacillus sp. 2RAB27 TaxID=3232991 RepID=UPI003F9A2010
MPGSVVGKALNFGYPGNVSRSLDAVIDNRVVKTTDTVGIAFGEPAILNSDNSYSRFGATGTAATFAGIAVRNVKQATVFANNVNGSYAPGDPCDVIGRGSVTVTCNVGTPTPAGGVYVRITANGAIPAGIVGGFEAAADGANTILLTNIKWTTGKLDANRTAEVTILSRINP